MADQPATELWVQYQGGGAIVHVRQPPAPAPTRMSGDTLIRIGIGSLAAGVLLGVLGAPIIGPVLAIVRAKDVDQALAIENASTYGNAASVFTESGGLARYVTERASAGMVGVNVGVPVPREPFSFGGWNDSKYGVGDITGHGSIEFWTRAKKTTTKWNREAGVNWMS